MNQANRTAPQMHCANCCRAGAPDTWLPGSNRTEITAWSLLGLPGLLYCVWRYLARAKICRFCGSQELIREARSSMRPARTDHRISRLRTADPYPWPGPLRTPLHRLRYGSPLAALGTSALGLACLGAIEGSGLALLPPAAALWVGSWLFAQMGLLCETPPPCRAWDEQGRSLRVEWL